jgi:hypothetical protein
MEALDCNAQMGIFSEALAMEINSKGITVILTNYTSATMSRKGLDCLWAETKMTAGYADRSQSTEQARSLETSEGMM